MTEDRTATALPPLDEEEVIERVRYGFGFSRRSFVQILGAGLLVAVSAPALAQRRGGRGGGGGARTVEARIHFGKDGSITVLTGKVEAGQGARAELTLAAAEELRVPAGHIQLVMSDTATVPNDGITAGSGSSPRTVPAIREGAATARGLLVDFAAARWKVDRSTLEVRDGAIIQPNGQEKITYADLATSDNQAVMQKAISSDITLTPMKEWKVLGKPLLRPNGREVVTGAHHYPSDVQRPGMLYGKVLRAPAHGARLAEVDLTAAKAMKDVVVVQDDQFVGVAAPTTFEAEAALEAIVKTAKWERTEQPSSKDLAAYLERHAQGGLPKNPFADDVAKAKKTLRKQYYVPYAQHAPLEPRAAVAEWADGKLTVWTGSQNPFGCRDELTRSFHLSENGVRVIVPDFGAGFGGKHSGEVGVEAARLAKAAERPVSLRWTRAEEFSWAYFRPAAVVLAEATLDDAGKISTWQFVNINSGRPGIETPYRAGKNRSDYVESKPPLRHGSYRALAATANNFAREVFMDELAEAAGSDPLEFRLAHLENDRLRAVLETATSRFGWKSRVSKAAAGSGVGLACGTEKGSYVAACVEVEVDRKQGRILVRRVSQAFECGAILNPANLLSQVQGAIVMGLGPALREEVQFENGEMLTTSFRKYQVPRFQDLPELDIHLLDRPDLPSAGAGETPIIAIAPAIANAVFRVTGERLRSMPLGLAVQA